MTWQFLGLYSTSDYISRGRNPPLRRSPSSLFIYISKTRVLEVEVPLVLVLVLVLLILVVIRV